MPTSTTEPAPKMAYSINELPAVTSLGRTTIFDAMRKGELVARKRGRRTIVLADDLQSWLVGMELAR